MTSQNLIFRQFPVAEKLVASLAAQVSTWLAAGLAQHGHASLVVSGGATPVPFFTALATSPLDWRQVFIGLADERWVDTAASDSNENLVRRHLLRGQAAAARFIGLKTAAATARLGEKECAQRLRQLPMPFDVLILGMGRDGHTASLFPDAAELTAALDMDSGKCCMATTPPAAPHERMTLTLPALLNSRQIILHISGEEKRQVYEAALADGPVTAMPIRAILRQTAVPVTVFWAP